MSTVAIMLVKDEADIIETTVCHLATQVDEVWVYDNVSTDGTYEVLTKLKQIGLVARLEIDVEVGYYQSKKMSELADRARRAGHEWIVPCDADEIWYSVHGRIGDLLGELDADVAHATLWDHVSTARDSLHKDPTVRIGWRRREAGGLPKVACRARPGLVIEMGNHGAHYPGSHRIEPFFLTIRHYPYRSIDQMISKVGNGAAAYAATNLPPEFGRHWREYGDLLDTHGPSAIAEIFTTWFFSQVPETDPDLIYDPAPVQREWA